MPNKTRSLTLTYDCEPDEHGCINGIELAGEMMAYAAQLLAPYVNSCPGCIDNLFSIIAEKSLTGLHQELNEGRAFIGVMLIPIDEEKDREREAAHVAAMQPLVEDLLEEAKAVFGNHGHDQDSGLSRNIPS